MRKEMRKRVLSLMLCVLMVLGLVPVMPEMTKAEDAVNYVRYEWNESTKQLTKETKSITDYTKVVSGDTAWGVAGTEKWYVVSETITLDSRVSVVGDVHLILTDDVSLTVIGGIGLADANSHITIYGQDNGTGELTVNNVAEYYTGIGANYEGIGGNITIYGGKIAITGGFCGTGIGSGAVSTSGVTSTCGDITIYNGEIEITAGSNSAGIGSGAVSTCGNITIYGGNITATGGAFAAGIGSGDRGKCGDITIYGGNITATGGASGAGIGSGQNGGCRNIAIYDGNIIATTNGIFPAAGIGSGQNGACGNIAIYDGNITATGGIFAAGIGSGQNGGCGNIAIYDGNITATGGPDAAGIGHGNGSLGSITFTLNGNAQVYTSSIDANETNLSSGLLFAGNDGTVYGEVTISEDFEIGAGQSLTISDGASLTIEEDVGFINNGILINNGIIINNGDITNYGTLTNNGTITNGEGGTIHNESTATIICNSHSGIICNQVGCCVCNEFILHELDYTVDGNSITANCNSIAKNCDVRGTKLTLTAESVKYSGNPCKAQLTIDDGFPVSVRESDIIYKDNEGNVLDGAPVEVGTYTASISISTENGNISVSVEYTIRQASLTIVAVSTLITEKDYDGKVEIELSDITLNGIREGEVVGLDISKLTAKLPSSDAGEYINVILSGETVLTGEDAANYSIEPVSGEYLLTDRVIVHPIELEVTDFWRHRDYVYTVETVETIDLSEFLPEDCGPIAFSMPEITGDIDISVDSFELGDNHTLSYFVPKGEIGDTGTIRLSLRSVNYSEISLTIEVKIRDKYEVIPASHVTLKSNTLYVGEALSKLEFNPVKFMANGQEIEGTLAWKDATLVPEKGTTSATWVFTPVNSDLYQTLTGTIAISVYDGPYIEGDDDKQGWDVIRDAISEAKEGDTIEVIMNGTVVVPGDIIQSIKGKDINIVFDMGYGIVWTVNGKTVTKDTIADVNLCVLVGTSEAPLNQVPVTILNALVGDNAYVEIGLLHNGEFGFTAELSINVEAENAGLFGNLYYYNSDKQVMEFVSVDEIAADGTAEFTFTHASAYVIVIDDADDDVDDEDDEDVDDEDDDEPTIPISPETGDKGGYASYMMLMLAAGSIIAVLKKRVVRH